MDGILKVFIKNDFLREGHASEIRKLLIFNNLSPWLDRESAMLLAAPGACGDKTLTRVKVYCFWFNAR